MIKELIVVEGKNDAQVIRRALGEVDVIWTEGYGLTEAKMLFIKEMAERKGVIVFTDPDSVGEQIRERIRKRVPQAKHVYLSKEVARKKGDIGVENAAPEEIRRVFEHIQEVQAEDIQLFSMQDLIQAGLVGKPESVRRRKILGRALGLGDANAKQFLHRLNRFGISREEFWQGLEEVIHGECS